MAPVSDVDRSLAGWLRWVRAAVDWVAANCLIDGVDFWLAVDALASLAGLPVVSGLLVAELIESEPPNSATCSTLGGRPTPLAGRLSPTVG